MRHDHFKHIFLERDELLGCREALGLVGLSMDLCTQDIGPAKLVVSADIAWQVVGALVQLKEGGRQFNCRHVVVSADLEDTVKNLVKDHAPRFNPVREAEVVNLESPPPIPNENTNENDIPYNLLVPWPPRWPPP
jgi:hypothetical protein